MLKSMKLLSIKTTKKSHLGSKPRLQSFSLSCVGEWGGQFGF